MIQSFVPLLLKSEDARIINMSSGMGELKSLLLVHIPVIVCQNPH